jgi:hypothetical protein
VPDFNSLTMLGLHRFSLIWSTSPTHKRAEGRAPLWGSELASKDASLKGGVGKFLLGSGGGDGGGGGGD